MSCHILLFIFFSNEPKHILLVLEHDSQCLFFDIEIRVSSDLKKIQKPIKRMQVLILQDGLSDSFKLIS